MQHRHLYNCVSFDDISTFFASDCVSSNSRHNQSLFSAFLIFSFSPLPSVRRRSSGTAHFSKMEFFFISRSACLLLTLWIAYDTDIFTEPTIKGKLGTNAMKAQRHLYDHIVYDSTNERNFAADLDTNTDVAVYVKLPDSFYIATPVGHYNPDWAIAFYEGTVKHIYFVAETKGSMSSMQLRLIEESKIHCARKHFKAISSGNVVYDVVDSYQTLLERVMK